MPTRQQTDQPEQTDNRPRPEDGAQDLPQEPGSVVGEIDPAAAEQEPS
jgi:hypothetical protein